MHAGDEDAHVRHAQAVRFLTSLRSSSKDTRIHLTPKHVDFLHSKGMSDDEIERARQDAERPDYTNMMHIFDDDQARIHASGDSAAFEQAADSFRAPLLGSTTTSDAPPIPPAASYPRSPLVLYSAADAPVPRRDATQILSDFAASMARPRYDTLVSYFRLLHLLLMLTGGGAAIVVAMYRKFLMPKITAMIEARTSLLSLQLENFGKMLESLTCLRSTKLARLLPDDYKPTWTEQELDSKQVQKSESGQECGSNLGNNQDDHSVQDEKQREHTKHEPSNGAMVNSSSNKQDSALSFCANRPKSEPEEPSQWHVSSVNDDETSEGENAHVSARIRPTRRRVLEPIDITHPLRESLSRLAQTLRNAHRSSTYDTIPSDTDEHGLLDLTPIPEADAASSGQSLPHSDGPSAGIRAFRKTLDQVRNELRASVLSDDEPMSLASHRFSAYTQASSSRPTSGPAVEIMQMKADIRSLKGLLLSRRNFPSFMRSARATSLLPSSTATSSS